MFAVVVDALGLRDLPFSDPRVKEADDWALSAEAWHLMASQGRGWWCFGLYDGFTAGHVGGRAWDAAEYIWLKRHAELCASLGLIVAAEVAE